MKLVIRIIGLLLLLLFLFGFIIVTQQNLLPMKVSSWELWILGVIGLLALAANILAYKPLEDAAKEAIKFLGGCIKAVGSEIKAWSIGQKVVWGIITGIVIFALVGYFFRFYTISVSVPIIGRVVGQQQPNTPTPNLSLNDQTCVIEQHSGIIYGIGVQRKGEDCIGISDGNAIFDLSQDMSYRATLAKNLQTANGGLQGSDARSYLDEARNHDKANAEPYIYYEDTIVQSDHIHPHETIIVATILTGNDSYAGSDVLQGVYLQQNEHNEACQNSDYQGCVLLNVLIANIGTGIKDESDYTEIIAKQIVESVKDDSTIVGVMSGTTSQATVNLSNALKNMLPTGKRLPIVAASATLDVLPQTGFLFRVVPPNSSQAQTASDYVKQVLHKKRIAILYRMNNAYASNLEADFSNDFSPRGQTIYQIVDGEGESFKADDIVSIQKSLTNALKSNPDLLYCACYARDVNTILQWFTSPQKNTDPNKYKDLKILGGDTFYQLRGYTSDTRPQMYRLYFTSFSYPDLWNTSLNNGMKPPSVIDEYKSIYGNNTGDGVYGRTRIIPGVAVAYDAMLVLATSCNQTFRATASDLTDTIAQQNIIGISGRIVFGKTKYLSDPYNKIIVVIQNQNNFYEYTGFEEGSFV